jgi:hypothetical protein
MVTLYFTRQFRSGILKGMTHLDSLPFVSVDCAMAWVKAIKASTSVNYSIVDHSFQNYRR